METIKNKYAIIGIIVFVLLIIGGVILFLKLNNNKLRNIQNLYEASQDSLRNTTNKFGESSKTISVLQAESINQLLKLKIKDKEIIRIQEIAEKYKSQLKKNGVIISSQEETIIKLTGIVNTIKRDTVWTDSGYIVYPEYECNISDKWIKGTITSNKDTCNTNLRITNEYDIIIGMQRNGFLKKKTPFAEITNHNPYTETKTMRVFQISTPKRKWFSLNVNVSYGINHKFELNPYVGIGLGLNIINF